MKTLLGLVALTLALGSPLAHAGETYGEYTLNAKWNTGAPISNARVWVNEYKTTWLDGTTNKAHKGSKTDANGSGKVRFKYDNYSYFDTHVCIKIGDQSHCGWINTALGNGPVCLDGYSGDSCEKAEVKIVCDFELLGRETKKEGSNDTIYVRNYEAVCHGI